MKDNYCRDFACRFCNENNFIWIANKQVWRDRRDKRFVTHWDCPLSDLQTAAADNDIINKPEHYTLPRAASDCFSVMQQIGLLNNHCVATAFQYLWRSGLKQQYISDLKKARWFIDKAIEKYEQEERGRAENK